MASLANKKETLAKLRQMIGALDGSMPKEGHFFTLLGESLPKGGVVEFCGAGKTSAWVEFLREHPQLRVVWLECELSLYPLALLQRDIDLERIFFLDEKSGSRENFVWALHQILQSHVFDVVTIVNMKFSETELRRWQLLAERSKQIVILLSQEPHASWVPALQIEVKRDQKDLLYFHFQRKRGKL